MTESPPAAAADKPRAQRPELPDFWCARFDRGATPWDAGSVPCALRDFVARQPHAMRTLIPGCGSAWEAAYLAAAGWPVTAVDFSPAAITAARRVVLDAPVELVCADFFAFIPAAPCSLVYERAFLCALPPRLRTRWAKRVAQLLPPAGLLAGFFFFCEEQKGPPFGMLPDELAGLLAPGFVRIEDRSVSDSVPVFAGRERWQVWRRC